MNAFDTLHGAPTFAPEMPRSSPLSPAAAAAELAPSRYDEPLDFEEIFGRAAPLEVDLGCGDGLFFTALAAEHTDRNFIGVERLLGRVRSACKKIAARDLSNARVLRCEIAEAVQYLFAPDSVAACHLLFPDPWPKRRHQARRIVRADWLSRIARALEPNGTLRMVTDEREYFEQMQREVRGVCELAVGDQKDAAAYPLSTFEHRYRASGVEIYRLSARKVSRVR